MVQSPSYKPCHCGAACDFSDESTDAEPCWGDVDAVDEVQCAEDEYYFVHACEGHFNFSEYPRGPYIPEPKKENS